MNDGVVLVHYKKALLFISPKCRSGGDLLETVIEKLGSLGISLLNDPRVECDPNQEIIRYQNDAELVIVGGGDGSVNLVLPTLIKTKLPLMVIPLGTANNLARSFEIPTDVEEALEILRNHQKISIDVGLVNGIPFANVAGLGLSTEINRRVSPRLKKKIGVFAFMLTGLRIIHRLNPFRTRIIIAGDDVKHSKSWQISVCNGRHYGSGMVIKDNATHEDEVLHLLSTEVKKWWKVFFLIPSLMKGKYNPRQELTLLAANEFRIETRRKLKIDVDGDIKTETPAEFKVLPKAINILVLG